VEGNRGCSNVKQTEEVLCIQPMQRKLTNSDAAAEEHEVPSAAFIPHKLRVIDLATSSWPASTRRPSMLSLATRRAAMAAARTELLECESKPARDRDTVSDTT
jgi:hypothetical protein